VEAICDRVVIIINGEVKADAHLDDLANTTDAVLVLGEDQKGIVDRLSALDGVERVETFQTPDGFPAYRVITDEDITPMLYDIARQENWPLRELRRDVMTLEMVFNQLAAAA
jgi:ABC-2 type transport system ATP-binding protein